MRRIVKVCPSCGNKYEDDTSFCPNEGTVLMPLTDGTGVHRELIGERLFGDYILKKKLGEGGMGAVYLAENVAIDQRIAIKVLHPEAANSDEIVQRFNREAHAIARLSHPNTIRVFIFGKTDEPLIYLAMEYVDGKSLRDVIHENERLSELRAINIMRQTLHALAEAHELGVVHRDLKPDNIMLTRFRDTDDFVKVLDFGIAKVQEKDGQEQKKLTQAGIVYGTPEYLSPEQAKGKDIDHRSDLYAMGIILYEMITGIVPFSGSTSLAILAGHVYQAPPDPAEVARVPVSSAMRRVILKAIAKSANDRYQNAMDFLTDLEKIEADALGSKSFSTSMIDVRQTGLIYEAARAARVAYSETEAQAEADRAKLAATAAVKAPPAPIIIHEPHPAQLALIARQKKVITALGILFAAMTCVAIAAIFLPA